MESQGLSLNSSALDGNRSGESDALAREILKHQEEDRQRSYLSRAIIGLSESFHGNKQSLERMEALQTSAMASRMAGDNKGYEQARNEMADLIRQDQASRKSASAWNAHTGGFLKSVGLFFPGKAGYALSAATQAADAARPEDGASRQGLDAILGLSKGLALKYGFDRVGQSEMNLALKAGTLSIANRTAEIGLNSHTYFDPKTGNLDLSGGLKRSFQSISDLNQLGGDALTFGGGYLLLRKAGIGPEFARSNPMLAQTIAGAGFGFSGGFFSDLQMQKKLGDGFDLKQAVQSALLQMSLDGAAATLGGARIQQMQTRAAAELKQFSQPGPKADLSSLDGHVVAILGLDNRPIARPKTLPENLARELAQTPIPVESSTLSIAFSVEGRPAAGLSKPLTERTAPAESPVLRSPDRGAASGLREFVAGENVSGLIARMREQGPDAQAILKVREILDRRNTLGPEQTILIQHADGGLKIAPEQLRRVDLLASCDPKLLESLGIKGLAEKHLFPDAGSSPVFLQVPGSTQLRFYLPEALKASGLSPESTLKLGDHKTPQTAPENRQKPMTAAEWLRSIDKNHRMSDLHDVELIARALERAKDSAAQTPISRYLGGGAETIAFETTQGGILRITDKPFRPEWGKRTLILEDGREVRFDASIIGPRVRLTEGDTVVNFYQQERGVSPVSRQHLEYFDRLIEQNRKYVFWDNDMSSWGQGQLAYVPLRTLPNGMLTAIPLYDRFKQANKGLALIDYDAVRIRGTEPKHEDGKSWRYGNYDFEPFDK